MQTERLVLSPLSKEHTMFIFELLNTDGWKRFIGNRNINNLNDAAGYIEKITGSSNIRYYTAALKANHTPIGLVTLIKRENLDCPDIGFAFLPQYSGAGYAYEATKQLLLHITHNKLHQKLQAITLPENTASIKLLEKLGFKLSGKTAHENETLLLYSIAL